jgi:pyruvate-ferredoxin/flavodoxin oxidoreductase
MVKRRIRTIEGNEAVSSVAHRVSEVIAIYPITPSSGMGEYADEWSAKGQKNIWGTIPDVVEMQSEAGAAAAVHGSLQAGALTTTFTASQGLLLMIPNMYKIAGELTPYCMHVSARSIATHALSIFGDHSDVMACRQIGFGMLSSCSVQEAHDLACIGTTATLKTKVPFLHFFDGFRTTHEINIMEELTDADLRAMMDEEDIRSLRERALSPDRPILRGTAQNPDTFFQSRERCNPFYDACADTVQQAMDRFTELTGRQYKLFDYVGHPEAERVMILMGSGAEAAHETVEHLVAKGEKVGLIKVRLYRPFSLTHFLAAIPKTAQKLAVLDRTKEPGALGEPLYMDVITALEEGKQLTSDNHFPNLTSVVGGRYGLSSKEFNPAMVKAVYDELSKDKPKNHFTVGIVDDVTHTSLDVDYSFDIEADDVVRAMFFGLGADGTVGANKNSIKIIGEETEFNAQGYFVYDSKKSGAGTISHLRFGPRPIRSTYLVSKANFIGCHQFTFLDKLDILGTAADGAIFLLNSPYSKEETWEHLPREIQQTILERKLEMYVIDAYKVAGESGMGQRINTIMQTCFFAISGVLPRDEAIAQIKKSIQKTYGKKGDEVVRRNFEAVDHTLAHLFKTEVPDSITSTHTRPPIVSEQAPEFTRNVQGVMLAGKGDSLPVSAFPIDGTWPVSTTQWEKRNIALEVPVWDPSTCIQCNKCSLVCPHAALRAKVYDPAQLDGAPDSFKSVDYKAKDFAGWKYTVQCAPEDCTGCKLCISACPAKNKAQPKLKAINMEPQLPLRETMAAEFDFFLNIPDVDRTKIANLNVKGSQFLRPLFEYSGACTGCGETAYVKLLSQLFGDRLLIGNATGCSSIYGGNLPTTPYCVDDNGRGPTWSNSLFEDAAEFGFGFRLAIDTHRRQAEDLLRELAGQIGENLVEQLLASEGRDEIAIADRRQIIETLKQKLVGMKSPQAKRLGDLADYLARKSVWSLGGDGWAYDIGYGGLDHCLANYRDHNILVMDTEVYSNTGGQASKATPLGAAAKFAAAGKDIHKKDLGLMAMSYGHVYVASVAMGAKDAQTVKAFVEADSYPGPSIIIAYSHCIAHGYDLSIGLDQQKRIVDTGIWPLFRFDPRRVAEGKPPLQLDSKVTSDALLDYMRNETRFRMVEKMDPVRFKNLANAQVRFTQRRIKFYEELANLAWTSQDEN